MISATHAMQPLPVRPVEPIARIAAPQYTRAAGTMHPLPVPTPEPLEMIDAIRTAAFQRMLDRHDVRQPA